MKYNMLSPEVIGYTPAFPYSKDSWRVNSVGKLAFYSEIINSNRGVALLFQNIKYQLFVSRNRSIGSVTIVRLALGYPPFPITRL